MSHFDPKAFAQAIKLGDGAALEEIIAAYPGCLTIKLRSAQTGSYSFDDPLSFAAHTGLVKTTEILLKHGAPLEDKHIQSAREWQTVETLALLERTLADRKKEEELAAQRKAEEKNREKWTLTSPYEVVREKTIADWRLTDIFNFQTRERMKIMKSLDNSHTDVKHYGFDDMKDKSAVEQAFERQKELGGLADPQSVVGPVSARNLKAMKGVTP